LENEGQFFLALCGPASRYSPDEKSGAVAFVGFMDMGLCSSQPQK